MIEFSQNKPTGINLFTLWHVHQYDMHDHLKAISFQIITLRFTDVEGLAKTYFNGLNL